MVHASSGNRLWPSTVLRSIALKRQPAVGAVRRVVGHVYGHSPKYDGKSTGWPPMESGMAGKIVTRRPASGTEWES